MSVTFGGTIGTFQSDALASAPFRVHAVESTERISHLYEYVVRVVHDSGALTEDEISKLLLAPCMLTLHGADPIHGIAREVHVQEARTNAPGRYDIVIVPTVWLLTVSRLSRLYQAMSVKDIATEVLERYGLSGHYDLRISSSQPRELCVQYEESDWDFLQRWFEHEGYFYWFEHSADGEKLVVTDDNGSTTPIAGASTTLPYRDEAGMARSEESVMEWRAVQRRIPASVALRDYNDQKPLLLMAGQADVDTTNGFGVVFEYGENFDSPADGTALAQKRAERHLTERLTLTGVTDSPRFHVGHWFALSEHFQDAQNRQYLITAVTHSLTLDEEGAPESGQFRIGFEAVPYATPFRPARTTRWPSIHGLMHGHIDSDSSGKFSTLDSQARYRVHFPFDSANKAGDSASTWVRMAQHYAGSGYGSHFPLHKGTEVLLAFFDGDPDRPVIVGTLPNPVTPAPSANANATQSVIKTASGIQITMDDQVGG